MKILVTGSAGFIGFHFTERLLKDGYEVVGIDNLNDYYDVNLKYARLEQLEKYNNFKFVKMHLEQPVNLNELFHYNEFDCVINLAAQAGVRYSIENPHEYIWSNVYGFLNILECCKRYKVKHLIYASSSSVYGMENNTDKPVSIYAATKKSNELMAYTYNHLYGLKTTGLRFFTVYGPYGRPDMALFKFTKSIIDDKPIDVYNSGNMTRDFTYIDDVIECLIRVINNPPEHSDYKIYDIGNNSPVKLLDFIAVIEKFLNKKAVKNLLPIQPGDVFSTHADITDFFNDYGYKPETDIESGIDKFVSWYKNFYQGE